MHARIPAHADHPDPPPQTRTPAAGKGGRGNRRGILSGNAANSSNTDAAEQPAETALAAAFARALVKRGAR